MSLKNLWKETVEVLERNSKSFDDVLAIYGDDFQISKENFKEVAMKTEYDSGYGTTEVAIDLKIIGKDFIMLREDYDGSEWWNFISNTIPKEVKTITKLSHNFYYNLSDINEAEEE